MERQKRKRLNRYYKRIERNRQPHIVVADFFLLIWDTNKPCYDPIFYFYHFIPKFDVNLCNCYKLN